MTPRRKTTEQLRVEVLIGGVISNRPLPICVEVSDSLENGRMCYSITTICHPRYSRTLGVGGLLGKVEVDGVLDLADKFKHTISSLRKAFPRFCLDADPHPQLGGGLGIRLPTDRWFFFTNRRNDWEIANEAANTLLLANMVFIAKKAYCIAVQRRYFSYAQIPHGFAESLADITNCFDCQGLAVWLESRPREKIIQLAQLFF